MISSSSDPADMSDHVQIALDTMKEEMGYRIGKILGKGTYGSVYKVTSKDYDVYAAKIVERRALNDMEVLVWPKLKHKNVLKLIHTICDVGGVAIFLTELMATNLFLRLQSREFKEDPAAIDKCRTYARQVLTGLSYLHHHKLCHLDLRAENVFLALEDDRAVVADFSGLTWSDTEKKFCPLPHSLRPPEMLTSKKRVPPMPVDLWSCGLLLANLFFGKGFYGCTVKHKRAGHIEAVQQYTGLFQCEVFAMKFISETYTNSSISLNLMKQLINLIHKFLNLNPKSRLNVDDALAHPFLAIQRKQVDKDLNVVDKPSVEVVQDSQDMKEEDVVDNDGKSEEFEVALPIISEVNLKSLIQSKHVKSMKISKWKKYKKWWKDIGKFHFISAPLLKYMYFKKPSKKKTKKIKKKTEKSQETET